MKRITFLLITVLTLLSSCDKPRCENTNPIYIENAIDSKVYNDELLKELSTEENLSFWLKEVKTENNKDYLVVNIYNENVCTAGQFLVRDWKGIESIQKSKGIGHRGAQLQGFTYSITYTNLETILNYKSLTAIID